VKFRVFNLGGGGGPILLTFDFVCFPLFPSAWLCLTSTKDLIKVSICWEVGMKVK
jgi:hypothetical protein